MTVTGCVSDFIGNIQPGYRSERVLEMRERSERCICFYETGKKMHVNGSFPGLVKSMLVDSGNRHSQII